MFDQKEWAGLDLVKYQNQIRGDISICCVINMTMFQYASVLYMKPELHFVIVVYHLAFNVSETLNDFIYSGTLRGPCKLHVHKQGKSGGFGSCDRPSNFTQIGFKSSIFQPV